MRFGLVVYLVFLSSGLVCGQQAPLNGPLEGFTFDVPTRSIRPVVGSLGSASLGQPLLRAAYGSVAPHQNYALTFQGDRCTLVAGLGSDSRSAVQIPGSFLLPEGVAWSGDGTTAILYSRTGNWVQVWSGLPLAVVPGPQLSLSALSGSLSTVTVDLHGERIVIGMIGESSGIFQIAGGAFLPLLSTVKPVSVAMTDDGKTLYALDSATNQVFELNLADMSSQPWPLDGLADPVALLPGKDVAHRAVVYVVGGHDRLLKVFDASTHTVVASVPLNFEPNMIAPLGSGSFFLGSRSTIDDILWSFTNATLPSVYFIPAMPIQLQENHRR